MSALTIKIKKGKSSAFDRIMEMVDCFEIVECKTHFKVNIDNEQLAIYHNLVSDVLKELPLLRKKRCSTCQNTALMSGMTGLLTCIYQAKNATFKRSDF